MVEVAGYTPGLFNWVELATSDREAAKRFYGELMGWQTADQPGAKGAYLLFQNRGRSVGGLYQLSEAQRSRGIAPHWLSYVSIANADETAKKAQELGGALLAKPFDVMGDRRVAIVADPTGAMFAVWQAKSRAGADVVREPGSVGWNELITNDAKVATDFYTQLLGWTAEAQEIGGGAVYTSFTVNQFPACGMMFRPEQAGRVPPHWMVYFQVEDCDASAKKVADLGGRLRVNPTDVPGLGRFAMVQDPFGATSCLIAFA